jgi:hypothetical protein
MREISSLTSADLSYFTPSNSLILRTLFSPRKLRISTSFPFKLTLMGKCEYTKRILYRKPRVTPTIMLSTWEHTVRTQASCLRLANHKSTRSLLSPTMRMSILICLKSRSREPRGPVTLTLRELTSTVTIVAEENGK